MKPVQNDTCCQCTILTFLFVCRLKSLLMELHVHSIAWIAVRQSRLLLHLIPITSHSHCICSAVNSMHTLVVSCAHKSARYRQQQHPPVHKSRLMFTFYCAQENTWQVTSIRELVHSIVSISWWIKKGWARECFEFPDIVGWAARRW